MIESPVRNGRPIAHWHPLFGEEAREPIARVRQRLVDKYGEERTFRMADTSRNLIIYPNLVINDIMAITVRYFEPLAPDNMEVTALASGAARGIGVHAGNPSGQLLDLPRSRRLRHPRRCGSPESCQIGFRATETEWSDISRGMLRPAKSTDELQMRGFWRQWHANMQGLSHTNVQDTPVEEAEAALALANDD